MGANLTHLYGLTETYGPYTICEHQEHWSELDWPSRARLLARQGVGMIQAERARVVDADTNDVLADGATMGEIVMRGDNVMKGYFGDEEATADAFEGGWFRSGDIGVIHPDGYVQLLDRAKDIIISGGENISSVEVEQALLRHEAVADVAVVGTPDPKLGDGGTQRLPRLIGRTAAMELLLTGDPIDAERALALGLVNMVVEPGELNDTVFELANRIASQAPLAVEAIKRAVRREVTFPSTMGSMPSGASSRASSTPRTRARV